MRRLLIILVLFLALAGPAHAADDEEDCLARTWQGTIGAVPVTLLFDHNGPDAALAGRYYYRTSLLDLLMIQDDAKPDRWKEIGPKGVVTGYLTLACRGNALSGLWSSPDGTKTLPVAAVEQPSLEFSAPRLGSLKTKVIERNAIGKFHYELFTAQHFESVQGLRLAGSGRAIAAINAALLKRFTSRLGDAIDCEAYGRLRRGEGHGYEYKSEMSVIAWNKSFVVTAEGSEEYCGGIHPLYGKGATIYNLQTGQTEDVSKWLIDKYREDIPLDSALGKIISKIYAAEDDSGDDDCINSVKLSGDGIWPAVTGITFRPDAPYAFTACIREVTVPYNKMAPYLSPQGKASIKAFQSR